MLGLGNILTKGGAVLGFPNKYSFNLDGSNDYLDLNVGNGLISRADIEANGESFSAWIKLDNVSGLKYVVGHGRNVTDNDTIYGGIYIQDTTAKFILYKNSAYQTISGTTTLSADTWYHIVGTYDGENNDDKMRIYINGSLEATSSALGGDFITAEPTIAYIGRNTNGLTPDYFDGLIDEVAIFDTALSANDVAKIASKPVDFSKASTYATDRTSNLKLWLRAGDKAEPESTTAIARQDFYTDFDGIDDYLQFPEPILTTNHSISFWIHTDSTNLFYLFSEEDANTDGVHIYIYNNFIYYRINSVLKTESFSYTNNWVHICGTYDGSTMNLYGNGQLLGSGTSNSTTLSVTTAPRIGSKSYFGQFYFNGSMSSLSLYQTALDAQTISQMAKSRFTPMRDNRFSVVDFDGSNDYIQLGSDISLTGEFTFNFWYNTTYTGTNYLLGHSTESGFVRTQNTGERFGIQFNSVSTFTIILSTTLPLDGTWNNITITRDSSDTIKCYLNGSEVGTSSSRSGDFDINRIANYASNQEYNGSLSSASIYNTAKSAEEIYAIYQQGITYDESSLSGLVGYWRMGDDTSASYPTIADSSSNSNDGTITNGASDDIVQQMVAGYDLGAFESSSEELSGEIVQDSSFELSGEQSAGTNGTYYNLDSEVSISNGQLISNATSSTSTTIVGGISVEQGKVYKIEIVVASGSSNANISISNGNNTVSTGFIAYSEGSNIVYYTPSATTILSAFKGQNGSRVWTIDSFSFKEVLQSEVSDTYPAIIDVNEPVLGADQVTNGTFDADSNWTKGTGWSIGSGVASCDGTQTGNTNLQQNDVFTVGNLYKITFDLTRTAGNFRLLVGSSGSSSYYTTDGSFTLYATAVGNANLYIQGDSNFIGTVDNVTVKEIQGNVGTMTNQDSADLVYSSVLPDQSFLATGVNSAYNFIDLDGSNEYIEGSDTIPAFGTNPFSVSVWVNPTSTNQDGLFANAGSLSGNYFFLSISATNFVGTGTSSAWKHRFDSSDTQLNTWQLLTYVREGTGTNQSKWYINGELKDTSTDTTNWLTGNGWHIGAYGDSIGHFLGSIGQLAIWNDALTASEVNAIYTLGRHGNLLDSYSDNLLGYWAMSSLDAKTGLNDVGDGTIYDRSGNSNHGTATNTESADLKSSPNAEPNGYSKSDTNRSNNTP